MEKSKPLLEQIKIQIQTARSDAPPKSVLAKACNYTLTLWTRLSRFLEYSQLELSNNLAENSMRPVALGRRNWIQIGSEQAGPRVAAILIENVNIDVYTYGVLVSLATKKSLATAPRLPGAARVSGRNRPGRKARQRSSMADVLRALRTI